MSRKMKTKRRPVVQRRGPTALEASVGYIAPFSFLKSGAVLFLSAPPTPICQFSRSSRSSNNLDLAMGEHKFYLNLIVFLANLAEIKSILSVRWPSR
jgi:hypothetical protein